MLGPNSSSGSCYMSYGTSRNNGNNARNLNRCFGMDFAPEFINTDLLVQQRYWAYNGATASGQESGVCAAIFKIPMFYTVTRSEICMWRTAAGGINLIVWCVEINYTKYSCSVVLIDEYHHNTRPLTESGSIFLNSNIAFTLSVCMLSFSSFVSVVHDNYFIWQLGFYLNRLVDRGIIVWLPTGLAESRREATDDRCHVKREHH
jgi:hypothetical protein